MNEVDMYIYICINNHLHWFQVAGVHTFVYGLQGELEVEHSLSGLQDGSIFAIRRYFLWNVTVVTVAIYNHNIYI